jgi:hypothetical protein
MAVPPEGVALVVRRSRLILSVFRSSVALDGRVNWIIEEGPALVAPFVSKRNLFLLKPVRAAVANETACGITSIVI